MDSITVDESSLKTLFQKHRDSPVESLLPEELNILITSFLPSQSPSIRAQSLIFLSKLVSDIRHKYASQSDADTATTIIVRVFSPPMEARLADTNEPSTLTAIIFLAALFQVDSVSACTIFSRDSVLDSVMEAPELYPSSTEIPRAVASVLSQASGHKQCRSLIAAPQTKSWLESSTRQTADHTLRAAAAVALVKLSQGSEIDAQSSELGGISTSSPAGNASQNRSSGEDDKLVKLMKDLVITEGHPTQSTLDAVEGLAYLTVQPSVKETISSDTVLLKRLVTLVPRRPSAPSFPASHANRNLESNVTPELDFGLCYGIAVIITNLCGYKPRLSEEEQQIEKLRRMTKEPGSGGKLSATRTDASADPDMLNDDDHVRARGKRLMEAGVVDALSGIAKGLGAGAEKRSVTVQRTIAKAFLSLIEEKANRGKILQAGGAKSLLTLIYASLAEIPPVSGDNGQKAVDGLDPADLFAIQALAKLAITSPPAAVFGPAQDSYVDAIRPFTILLTHSSVSLLQKFEALMALTNMSSVSPDAADRVSAFRVSEEKNQSGHNTVGDIVKRAEALLLDGNTMLRRAAVELVCNLVGGAEGSYDYFGGTASINAKSRLQILVALSDVEDLPTRLAASGALATLTTSPHTCHSLAKLEMERHRLLPMLVELIYPEVAREYREERPEDEETEVAAVDGATSGDPGLVHRGVICVRNVFANLDAKEERKSMSLEAEKRGLVRALVHVVKSNTGGPSDSAVLRPAAEVLKWIIESGVKLPL